MKIDGKYSQIQIKKGNKVMGKRNEGSEDTLKM